MRISTIFVSLKSAADNCLNLSSVARLFGEESRAALLVCWANRLNCSFGLCKCFTQDGNRNQSKRSVVIFLAVCPLVAKTSDIMSFVCLFHTFSAYVTVVAGWSRLVVQHTNVHLVGICEFEPQQECTFLLISVAESVRR